MDAQEIGTMIQRLREQQNLTQKALAECLAVSDKTISKWETNETVPNIYQSKKLAQIYNVSLDDLIVFDMDVSEIREMTLDHPDRHVLLNSLDIQLKLVKDRMEQMQLVEQAIQENTKAVFIETLGNPNSEVVDIEKLAEKCRFHNCTHTSEPGCAVRVAMEDGIIDEERLKSYKKLKAENLYMEDTGNYMYAKKKKFKRSDEVKRYVHMFITMVSSSVAIGLTFITPTIALTLSFISLIYSLVGEPKNKLNDLYDIKNKADKEIRKLNDKKRKCKDSKEVKDIEEVVETDEENSNA